MKKLFLGIVLLINITLVFSDDLNVNGLISQGYMKSNHNGYLTDSSKGSFQFNETVLSFGKYLNNDFRVGIQFLSRDLGDIGNNEFGLDWGIGEFTFDNNDKLIFGKFKLPFGLYNEGRDIDMLRTQIFLPQSTYNEHMRSFIGSISGFNYSTQLYKRTKKSLKLKFSVGTMDIKDEDPFMSSGVHTLATNINYQMRLIPLLSPGTPVPDYDIDLLSGTNHKTYGGYLEFDSICPGLKIVYSNYPGTLEFKAKGNGYFTSVVNDGTLAGDTATALASDPGMTTSATQGLVAMNTFVNSSAGAIDDYFDLTVDVTDNSVIGFEYLKDQWEFAYEWKEYEMYTQLPSFVSEVRNTFGGYYFMTNYVKSVDMTYGLCYSKYYRDLFDKNGDNVVNAPYHVAFQKDMSYTIKKTVSENLVIKLEYHDLEGTGQVYGDNSYKKWNMLVFKTTVSF